jgi:endonuclease/exonuclease/phosphatase family metal-dependent hydrolase
MTRWWWLAALVAIGVARCTCVDDEPREPLRLATFNIKNFPQDRRQIDGAFAEIRGLGASFVGVQEISEPALFAREATSRLGPRWQFVSIDTKPVGQEPAGHHNGVLFDGARWAFAGMRVFDGTRVGTRHKPTLEVRLRRGDRFLRVLVVHFKSGTAGRIVRAAQHVALRQIVRDVQKSGEPVVLLGDFNATEADDREDLATLAKLTKLAWATEDLACSAFWSRDDGCPRSRLDHVFTWTPPIHVHAAGACASEGCDWQASCPIYARTVSDHCPVVVDVE